jgi:hypothetical protein
MNTVSLHINNARQLADDELLARITSLAAQERGVTVELIAHLAELETRRLHLAAGYPSMFAYCRRVLRLSESSAYKRIQAARTARGFPVLLDLLAEGTLNLTTVLLLAPHLTAANHVALLESARGLSKREVEQIVARLAPVPDLPTSIRKMPAPRAAAQDELTAAPTSPAVPAALLVTAGDTPPSAPPVLPPAAASPAPLPPAAPRAVVNALSPDRYRMQLTIGGDTLEMYELARDMLRHAVPSGDAEQILKRALAVLIQKLARRRFAATDRPRPSNGVAPGSHRISAKVRRVVFVRDLGRCAYVSRDGRRCNERACLEFHHVKPYVEGGLPTVENIQLRCRAHNVYEWELRSREVRRIEDEWYSREISRGAEWRPASAAARPRSRPGRCSRAACAAGRRRRSR